MLEEGCPACESENVAETTVSVTGASMSGFAAGESSEEVEAVVCEDCGHAEELYAHTRIPKQGSKGLVRRAQSSLTPKDASLRDEIMEAAARALFVNAWAQAWEDAGRSTRSWAGQDLMDVAPPTNEDARQVVAGWVDKLEAANGASLDVLYERAAAANNNAIAEGSNFNEASPKDFGYTLAMEAMGHGVSWTDDHAPHGLKKRLPDLESWLDVELGSESRRGSRGVVRRAMGTETRLLPLLRRVAQDRDPLVAISVIGLFAHADIKGKERNTLLYGDPGHRTPGVPIYVGPLGLIHLRDDVGRMGGLDDLATLQGAVRALQEASVADKWWHGQPRSIEEPVPGFVLWLAAQIEHIIANKIPIKGLDPRTPSSNRKILLDTEAIAQIRVRRPRWFTLETGEAPTLHQGSAHDLAIHYRLAALWHAWDRILRYAEQHPDTWRSFGYERIIRETRGTTR